MRTRTRTRTSTRLPVALVALAALTVCFALAAPEAEAKKDRFGGGTAKRASPFGNGAGIENRPLIIALGLEFNAGALHPGGFGFLDTLDAYGYDEGLPGLININGVAEVFFRPNTFWELGVHGAYNGFFDHASDGKVLSVNSQEIGPAARLVIAREGAEVGFRLETGYLRSVYTLNKSDSVEDTFFVRPALSVGTGGVVGVEFTLGWTFAQVFDGVGPGQSLPHGGLDAGLLFRFEPVLGKR